MPPSRGRSETTLYVVCFLGYTAKIINKEKMTRIQCKRGNKYAGFRSRFGELSIYSGRFQYKTVLGLDA